MSWKIAKVNDPSVRARLEAALRNATPPVAVTKATTVTVAKPQKRLRQSDKPLMNKLEAGWSDYLKRTLPATALATLRPQALRFRLANGAAYTPDFTAVVNGVPMAWECKGPAVVRWAEKGALTVKMAATLYPEWSWYFVWKIKGEWHTQRVYP